ncbi:MAG: hypothetical protein FJ398_08040 [Verrucomicrobia bacterium]|nr:hypothetical protein [Verrucomicrobiota bacterium]
MKTINRLGRPQDGRGRAQVPTRRHRRHAKPERAIRQGGARFDPILLCHLANVAWRMGNTKLAFDAKTETFPRTPEANQFLKRPSYRTPWVIRDSV